MEIPYKKGKTPGTVPQCLIAYVKIFILNCLSKSEFCFCRIFSSTKPLCGTAIFSTHRHIENIRVHIEVIGDIGVV